jgi:hypothetical protein
MMSETEYLTETPLQMSMKTPNTSMVAMRTSRRAGPPGVDCHILVSSKHLILASPAFKAKLQGVFKESMKLRGTGELEIPLPNDDPDVFLILLHILQHRIKKVSRLVSLLCLTKLAILVDKYQIYEPVEVFSDTWIDRLRGRKSDVPESLTLDVLP